jgi:SAM-dependent methyltransferase
MSSAALPARVSPGARADLAVGDALSECAPFFGSAVAAERLVDLAVKPLISQLAELGRCIHYADFGGGEGILAAAVRSVLSAAGVQAQVTVVDENPVFLQRARARQLDTQTTSLDRLVGLTVDLATLRFVNHYNPVDRQLEILRALFASIRPGGILICQIHTASSSVCELFGRVSALLDRVTTGTSVSELRHWVTLDVFKSMLEKAGFTSVSVSREEISDVAQVETLLNDAWRRYCGSLLRSTLLSGDGIGAARLLQERDDFFSESLRCVQVALLKPTSDEADRLRLTNGQVSTSHPIVIARR